MDNRLTRMNEILDILQKQHSVNVTELSEKFHVSEMTIRRDLNTLAGQYNISRTHGGAVIKNDAVVKETTFVNSKISHPEVKKEIAERAVSLIHDGQRILIDAGSTTRIMMDYFNNDMKNIVVTNHLEVAEKASHYAQLKVILLGGEMLKGSNCTYGPDVNEQLKKYRLDIAFLGTSSIGTDGKLYDGYSLEAGYKKIVFGLADHVYILADSSKFNTYDMSTFGSLDEIDGIITDSGISSEGRKLVQKYHVNLIEV